MPIYVVTSGSYSDYHIVACTTDLDAANRALKFATRDSLDSDSVQIHVYEDCKEVFIDMNLDKKNFYHVIVKEELKDVKVTKFTRMDFEYCRKLMIDGPSIMKYGHSIYKVDCCATDEGHAKEIAFGVISKYKN